MKTASPPKNTLRLKIPSLSRFTIPTSSSSTLSSLSTLLVDMTLAFTAVQFLPLFVSFKKSLRFARKFASLLSYPIMTWTLERA